MKYQVFLSIYPRTHIKKKPIGIVKFVSFAVGEQLQPILLHMQV